MARYFLHCTDGTDLVLDRVGIEISDDENLPRIAFGAALRLMRSLPSYRDWASWIVAVHDQDGHQIETMSFPDDRVFTDLLWQAGTTEAPAMAAAPREARIPLHVLARLL